MKGRGNPVANLIVLASGVLAFGAWLAAGAMAAVAIGVIGTYVSLSPRMLKEWERGVLLRLGRFQRVLGRASTGRFPASTGWSRRWTCASVRRPFRPRRR